MPNLVLKPGMRLRFDGITTEVIVTKGAEGAVNLTCADAPVSEGASPPDGSSPTGDQQMQVGKRYVDGELGVELLCTKAGAGGLACDGRPLGLRFAKPLPATD